MNFIFVVWLTDERYLALFPAGTIVRDPHHRESPTRHAQGLNLRRTNLSSGLVEWSCAVGTNHYIPASISAWILIKNVTLSFSINWPNYTVWLPLLGENLSNVCIVIAMEPSCDFINYKINLSNQTVFSPWPESQDTYLNILRTKRAFKMKLKAFFFVFKGLSLK